MRAGTGGISFGQQGPDPFPIRDTACVTFRDGRAVRASESTPSDACLREPQAWSRARLTSVLWVKGVYPRHFSSGILSCRVGAEQAFLILATITRARSHFNATGLQPFSTLFRRPILRCSCERPSVRSHVCRGLRRGKITTTLNQISEHASSQTISRANRGHNHMCVS